MGQEGEIDFTKFKLERVIDQSAFTKSITFQGTYEGQTAVVRLEKTPFDEKATISSINNPSLGVERNLNNDIYSRYKLRPSQEDGVNDLNAIVVMPANDTVLIKYSRIDTVLFSESAETYEQVVKPFIVNMLINQKDYNQWVFNILEGKSESDHVILNDPDPESGFMFLPSLKSSGEDELHLLALVHRRDIPSMRDLNASHLPLLTNILEKGSRTIREKFANNKGQIRSYIHYHPTFYHLHVHFEVLNPNECKSSDRDNLLSTVINNISLVSDYYQRATLTYPLPETSALYKQLASKGRIDICK